MDRQKLLMSYLPWYYQNSGLVQEMMKTDAIELVKIDTMIQILTSSVFIVTAEGDALKRYEDILAINGTGYDTETRRKRIIARLKGFETSTVEVIQKTAEAFLNCAVTVVEYNYEYMFWIEYRRTPDTESDIESTCEAIDEIKPAHLGYGVIGTTEHPEQHIPLKTVIIGAKKSQTTLAEAARREQFVTVARIGGVYTRKSSTTLTESVAYVPLIDASGATVLDASGAVIEVRT